MKQNFWLAAIQTSGQSDTASLLLYRPSSLLRARPCLSQTLSQQPGQQTRQSLRHRGQRRSADGDPGLRPGEYEGQAGVDISRTGQIKWSFKCSDNGGGRNSTEDILNKSDHSRHKDKSPALLCVKACHLNISLIFLLCRPWSAPGHIP